jgi:hypothetical protein
LIEKKPSFIKGAIKQRQRRCTTHWK